MRRSAAVREKIVYILAGCAFILLALALLYILLRGGTGKSKEKAPVEAPVTATAAPAAITDGITIAGREVSASADSFDLNGKTLTAADQAALASMHGLTTLSLNNCGITDVSFLTGLTGLRTLYLPGNQITNVAPLAGLTQLKTLYLDNNPVTDLSPLYTMTTLSTLSLQGISMADYVLEDIQSTMTWCRVFNDSTVASARPISIGGLAFTEEATSLDLSNRGISDISKLSYCLALSELNLYGNPLESISVLMGLPALTTLNLSDTGLDDSSLGVLKSLQKLSWLNIEHDRFTAEGVDQLKAALPNCNIVHDKLYYTVTLGVRTATSDATELDLRYCAVESLAGLEKFEDLTTLMVQGNGVTDLTPLQSCTKLETLDASENKLSSLVGLGSQPGLRKLYLSHNQLRDIYPLAACTALEELDLSYNNLDYLTHLTACTSLRTLNLTGNPALTAEQIRTLKEALPFCNIITDIPLDPVEQPADLPDKAIP